MICTDDFVFLHYPKTGGTFVADVLEELLQKSGRRFEKASRHTMRHELSGVHADKKILTCVRNPYDLRVSQYRYRWWCSTEAKPSTKDIRKHFWPYKKMSFEQFLDAWDWYLAGMQRDARTNAYVKTMGQFSMKFIWFFTRHPASVIADLDDNYLSTSAIREEVNNIHFLTTETLNAGLCEFLLSVGYGEDEVAFIRSKEKILPPCTHRQEHETWESFYTPSLKAMVRHRERMLFDLFPQFDV